MSEPRTAARLSKQLKHRLKQAVKSTGFDESEIVRLGLHELFEKYPNPQGIIEAVIRRNSAAAAKVGGAA